MNKLLLVAAVALAPAAFAETPMPAAAAAVMATAATSATVSATEAVSGTVDAAMGAAHGNLKKPTATPTYSDSMKKEADHAGHGY